MSSKRPAIDPSILLEAAKRVLIEKESKKSVSSDLNIPRTNLRRYIANIESEIPDITTATDDDLLDILDTTRTRGNLSVGFHTFFIFHCSFEIFIISHLSRSFHQTKKEH